MTHSRVELGTWKLTICTSIGCRSLFFKSERWILYILYIFQYLLFNISRISTFRLLRLSGMSFYSAVVTFIYNFQHCECDFWLVLNLPILIWRILFSIRNWLIHVFYFTFSRTLDFYFLWFYFFRTFQNIYFLNDQFSFEYIYFILLFPEPSRTVYLIFWINYF